MPRNRYQHVSSYRDQNDLEMATPGEKNKDDKKNKISYSPTQFENIASRFCYLRFGDLLTQLGVITENASTAFTGTTGKIFTYAYKVTTRIVIPFWKTGHEAHNAEPRNGGLGFSKTDLFNLVDFLVSTGSFIAGTIGREENDENALAAEKYLLFACLLLQITKDTIQLCRMRKTEAEAKLDSDADKQTLKQLEHDFSELHQQNQLLQNELSQIKVYLQQNSSPHSPYHAASSYPTYGYK